MCHFGTSILRLSYIYVYKGTRLRSSYLGICCIVMDVSCDQNLIPKADVALRALKRWPVAKAPKAPRRPTRCSEPPYLDVREAQRRNNRNETKETKVTIYNKSYDARNKSFQQKIISKSHVSHVSWILLEMLGSSHECFLESFGFNSQLTCCFWHFVTQALGQFRAWLKDTQKHQPPPFQHFHRFNTP